MESQRHLLADGPNVEANEVAGASGLIGVYIDIKPQTKEANRTDPGCRLYRATQVADDVSADNSITVTTQGSNTVVAAAGKAATGLEFSCYMNAKDFSMSSVALAVLLPIPAVRQLVLIPMPRMLRMLPHSLLPIRMSPNSPPLPPHWSIH